MTVDQGLAALGIVLTILFGVGAIFFAPKVFRKSIKQVQKSESGSTSIQAGRDIKIGKE